MSVTQTQDDPRLALGYQEALRGLLQQQAAVERLHNRAGTLVFASSFASSLLAAERWPTASAVGTGWHRNGRIIRRLREAFQLALVLLLNICAWLFSIAGLPN